MSPRAAAGFMAGAALLTLGLSAGAQDQDAALHKLPRIKKIGETSWGDDDYFKLRWKRDSEGAFVGAELADPSRELWVCAQKSEEEALLTRLNAYGVVSASFTVPAKIERFRILEDRGKGSRFVGMGVFDLWEFDPAGRTTTFAAADTHPDDFTVIPKGLGGPLVVATYEYGDAGLRAFKKDGRPAWELREPGSLSHVGLALAGRRPVLAATDGLGKVFVVDLRGTILERIHGEGNMERVIFDQDSDAQWMYGLDSGFESRKETLTVHRAEPGRSAGKRKWELVSTVDLGRITVTAWTLGRFEGPSRQLVLGTDNGWVLVLDRAGKVVTESRLRGSVSVLAAGDLDGDREEELIVGLKGHGENLFVFSRK